jgi:ABC-2 type transport system permease protein
MLKALIKTRLLALFSSFFKGPKSKKKRNKVVTILIGLLALYIIASLLMAFFGLFYSICEPVCNSGYAWLYFSMASIVAIAFSLLISIFFTKAQLFDAQDNDLLLSMPIPPKYILFSRFFMLIVFNYIIELLILAPAGVVYLMYYPATVIGTIFFILVFLLLPLITQTLSCIFGWLLAIIETRVRNKTFISTGFSLIFPATYFYFSSKMNEYHQALINNVDTIGLKMKSILPIYHLGLAIAEKNTLSLLIFLLFAAIPFAIVYSILSYSFVTISTTKKGYRRIKYTHQPLKAGSAKSALLKKELRLFFSSTTYIMNASLGVIFTLAFAVALFIYGDLPNLIAQNMPQLAQYSNVLVIISICFLASTNIISAPSISLEGKRLWISQSLPIDGSDVLLAKVKMHLVICLPSVLIASLACIITMNLSLIQIFVVLILPTMIVIFSALLGVVVNMHFPKFDWVNETVPIKQSMSTVITMFTSMAVVLLPTVLYSAALAQTLTIELFMIIYTIVIIALCLLMYRYLKTKGSIIFASLG